jgi:hypothetical protein
MHHSPFLERGHFARPGLPPRPGRRRKVSPAYRALVDKEYKFARIDRHDIASDLNAAAKIIASHARLKGSIMGKISNLYSAIVAVVKDRRPPAL